MVYQVGHGYLRKLNQSRMVKGSILFSSRFRDLRIDDYELSKEHEELREIQKQDFCIDGGIQLFDCIHIVFFVN